MPVEPALYTPTFAAIDFETANTDNDSACSIGVAMVRNGRIESLETRLIRPPTRYFQFTHVHGLTWRHVRQAPRFNIVWAEFSAALLNVDFLCAHNASFDSRVLHACCDRYGLAPPAKHFQCTVDLARSQWGIYPTKLPDVCRRLKIPLNHHEAGSDARACAQIVLAAIDRGWRWKYKAHSRTRRRARPAWVREFGSRR